MFVDIDPLVLVVAPRRTQRRNRGAGAGRPVFLSMRLSVRLSLSGRGSADPRPGAGQDNRRLPGGDLHLGAEIHALDKPLRRQGLDPGWQQSVDAPGGFLVQRPGRIGALQPGNAQRAIRGQLVAHNRDVGQIDRDAHIQIEDQIVGRGALEHDELHVLQIDFDIERDIPRKLGRNTRQQFLERDARALALDRAVERDQGGVRLAPGVEHDVELILGDLHGAGEPGLIARAGGSGPAVLPDRRDIQKHGQGQPDILGERHQYLGAEVKRPVSGVEAQVQIVDSEPVEEHRRRRGGVELAHDSAEQIADRDNLLGAGMPAQPPVIPALVLDRGQRNGDVVIRIGIDL